MDEKPTVFNYAKYIQVKKERDALLDKNRKLQIEATQLLKKEIEILERENAGLKERIANLEIRCRIAEEGR